MVKYVYASIDIGTDAIKLVVCELYKNKLNLLATSSVKSKGIRKGLISDVGEATRSIKQAFDQVEGMLGIKIKKVIASVPSYDADYTFVNSEIIVNNEGKIVTKNEILAVLQKAMSNEMKPANELVTIIPIDFMLDNNDNIRDPKGLVGSVLKARAIMVATPKKNIYSVVNLIESLGVEVVDITLNNIGDIYAARTKETTEQIGAIINIGSEVTTVSLYNKGIIVKSSILGMGGKNIDNDIAFMYKIKIEEARKIKEKFALASKKYASLDESYEVKTENNDILKINRFEVSEIAMSRIVEILTLAEKEISFLTSKSIQYVIITGGTSNMAHFEYVAEDVFNKKVTIGEVKLIGIRDNKFSSCVGNIIYFINKLKLKDKDYTMISSNDMDALTSSKKSVGVSNESMLGKVFGYFFGE